jgi:type II restriction/modification system DNA methylase subunit YeeA
MRVALIDAANYDWSSINPTIFGALFQFIKDKEARDKLGEHYTTEENINKVIKPLFLDELNSKLDSAWDSIKELKKLRADLAKIRILDPACGCGNFLVVAYRPSKRVRGENRHRSIRWLNGFVHPS